MKNIITFLALIIVTTIFAQSPEKMSYQAVIRDASNNLIANTTVGMQVSILKTTANGTAIYTETHTPITNDNGLISIEIGTGTTTDIFSAISWGNDNYFVKIETDPAGGTSYTITGTSQLLSVPYALHAKTANSIAGGIIETQNLDNVLTQSNDGGAKQIKNILDPTDPQDAVTKSYFDQKFNLLITANQGVTDIDGNHYNSVLIGNRIWMAENLKSTHYQNGDEISDGTGIGDISNANAPKYWFSYNDDLSNVAAYGRLYTWYAINDSRNVCPSGWHVPTNSEWTELVDQLGGEFIAGGKLKENGTLHWFSPNEGATNESGFTALPGGMRGYGGPYGNIGYGGNWWSLSENTTIEAYSWGLSFNNESIYFGGSDKKVGFSMRCVKN